MNKEQIIFLQNALKVETDGIIGKITRKAYADCILSIAEKEIGVKEIGNTNSGKRVQEYQAASDLDGTGFPWCACFIDWVFLQSKIFTEENRPKTAAAFGFQDWGKRLGMTVIKYPDNIKRGDIVIYRFSHIGICSDSSDKDGDFLCIEGNTNKAGQREGGEVLKKNRHISSVRSIVRL